jgi:hypothetical protein
MERNFIVGLLHYLSEGEDTLKDSGGVGGR